MNKEHICEGTMLERLHIGTSGWSYKHWSGNFYPEEVKPAKYLEYYVTVFDCVELNASFYRTPGAKAVEGWARRTPASFRFCVKMNRFITHRKRLADAAEPLQRFLAVFDPLRDRLGPFLVQLPSSLKFDSSVARDFLQLLASHQNTGEFALEARHDSWFSTESVSLLKHYGIAGVIADSGGHFAKTEEVTSHTVYLRFHGPGELYSSLYSTDSLTAYARKITGWLAEGRRVWAFFNNDFDAHAVRNARELQALVEQELS
ncbi:MAG: DUF72 domain-containing protein [Desulfobacterales bacterium]